MKLIAYRSCESGGMLGSYASTEIFYTNNGRCRVNVARKTFHSEPIKLINYYAEGLLEKLSDVCDRYNVISWTDLPEHNIVMYDSSSSTDNFTFEDGTKIILSSGKQYPEHAPEMFEELNKLIKESENYGVDVEIIEENSSLSMGMMGIMSNLPPNLVNVQEAAKKDDGSTKWAQYCVNCGAQFMGNQKFCSECGSVRQKL